MLVCPENYTCHIIGCRHRSTHIWESDCDCSCSHIKKGKSKCMVINVINGKIFKQGLLLVSS